MNLSHNVRRPILNTNQISEYVFIAYFFILSFFPFSADGIKFLLILIVIGSWITRIISEKKTPFTKTALNIPIFLFFLWSLIASFHSILVKDSLHTVLFDYLVYFVIFFCMVNTIQEQEQIKRMIKAMLITCGLVCAYGLYGYYTGIAIHAGRFVATFEYHSRIAKYISLLLPIAVCLFFYYKDFLNRLYLAILICVCGFSLILTMSRASWVAIFITTLFICFAVQKKYLIFILVGIGAVLIFILPSKFTTHAKTITQINQFFASEKILGERFLCWKASIAMIREHPFLGIGPGSKVFRNAYQQYGQEIKDKESQQKRETAPLQLKEKKNKKKIKVKTVDRLSHAHNIFLHICAGTGIVGLLIFLWLFATVFYNAIKSWRSLPEGYDRMLLIGITASLICIFSHGLTDSFWKKPDALFLWFIIGILFVIIRNRTGYSQKEFP